LFANNPAGWGLLLATTKVKIENVRMLSIGTSYPELSKENKNDENNGRFRYIKKCMSIATDKLLELLWVKENDGGI